MSRIVKLTSHEDHLRIKSIIDAIEYLHFETLNLEMHDAAKHLENASGTIQLHLNSTRRYVPRMDNSTKQQKDLT